MYMYSQLQILIVVNIVQLLPDFYGWGLILFSYVYVIWGFNCIKAIANVFKWYIP